MSAFEKIMISRKRHFQSGIVLPVVLIFMVVMMLLGVSAIRNVTLEEKMAGNQRNQQVAFQAAEDALRFCENYIQGAASPKFYVSQAKPTIGPGDKLPALDATKWDDDNYATPVTLNANSSSLGAACMIEPFQVSCKSLALTSSIEWCDAFRVTARGTGATSDTVVRIQSFLSFP